MVNENGNGANGLTRQMVYESNTLRLSTIKAGTASPWENLQKLSYRYDNVGNVTTSPTQSTVGKCKALATTGSTGW